MRTLAIEEVSSVGGGDWEDGAIGVMVGLGMAIAPEATIPAVIIGGVISGLGGIEILKSM